jgi:hypothetical protein
MRLLLRRDEVERAFHLHNQQTFVRDALVAVILFAWLVPVPAGTEDLCRLLPAGGPVSGLAANDGRVIAGGVGMTRRGIFRQFMKKVTGPLPLRSPETTDTLMPPGFLGSRGMNVTASALVTCAGRAGGCNAMTTVTVSNTQAASRLRLLNMVLCCREGCARDRPTAWRREQRGETLSADFVLQCASFVLRRLSERKKCSAII